MPGTREMVAALLAALALAGPLPGQLRLGPTRVSRDTLATAYRLDFVIPDAPAFDLVKVDPNTVLRPATVRELAMGLSDFGIAEGGLQIPRSFAVEVAPFLLAREKTLGLGQYQRAAALYRTRISAATGRDSANRAQMAFGVRISLLDRADMRTNPATQRRLTSLTERVNAVYTAERFRMGAPSDTAPLELTEGGRASIDREVAAFRRQLADSSWNADALDVAVAAGLVAEDSTGNNLTFDKAAAWVTYAKGLRTWGQLLLGARGTARRYTLAGGFHPGGGISSRLYVGVDRYKAFAEVGGTADRGTRPSWLLNSGGEVRFADSFWSTFSLGADWGVGETGRRPRLRSRFSLKLGLPKVGES